MNIPELFKKSNYKSVFNCIYKTYYKDKKYTQDEIVNCDILYQKAFDVIQNIESKQDKTFIIELQDAETDGEEFIDVCLREVNSKEIFALDFTSWSEVCSYDVLARKDLLIDEMAAHILWEMTFWGFSEEQIEKQKEATLLYKESDLTELNLDEFI
jgi:hypothetical protein